MAEANINDAKAFLEILDQSMERGRCAEAFFSILTNEEALRQKVCACVRVCVFVFVFV